MKEALGLIEAVGLAAAVEAADTCLKSANVKLIGYELTKGGGYVTVKISGDVGAVSAAVTAASAAAMKVRGVYSAKVIPRPSEALGAMVNSRETVGRPPELLETTDAASAGATSQPESHGDESGTEEHPASDEEAATWESPTEPDPVPGESDEAEMNMPENRESNDVFPEENAVEPEEATQGITCNICHNPACGRLKGEPRTKCITYKR